MNVTPSEINEAYKKLRQAQQTYSEYALHHIEAEQELADAEARHIRDGVPGSNKEKREAQLAIYVEKELEAVREAKELLDAAKMHLRLAEIEVERVRLLVRYDEIALRKGVSEVPDGR
jgi:hypothetical protein